MHFLFTMRINIMISAHPHTAVLTKQLCLSQCLIPMYTAMTHSLVPAYVSVSYDWAPYFLQLTRHYLFINDPGQCYLAGVSTWNLLVLHNGGS